MTSPPSQRDRSQYMGGRPWIDGDRLFSFAIAVVAILFVVLPALAPLTSALDQAGWQEMGDDVGRLASLTGSTALLVAMVEWIGLGPAALIGYVIARSLSRTRRFAKGVCLGMGSIPLVLISGGWLGAIGQDGWWPCDGVERGEPRAWLMVALIHATASLPWSALMIATLLEREPTGPLDAVRALGPRGIQRLALLWSELRAPLVPAALWLAYGVLTEMSVTDLFAVRSLAEEVYTQFESGGGAKGAILSCLPLAALFSLALLWIGCRSGRLMVTSEAFSNRSSRFQSTLVSWIGVVTMAAMTLPLTGLLWQLGLTVGAGGVTTWSARVARHYLVQEISQGRLIAETVWLALLCAAVATTAGFLISWRISQRPGLVPGLLIVAMAWNAAIPSPVLGVSVIDALNHPSAPLGLALLYDSVLPLLWARVARLTPLVCLLFAITFARMPRTSLESLQTLGLSARRQAWLLFVGPWRGTAILAFLLAALLAGGELPIAKLLAPPGLETWSMRLFHLLHTGTGNEQAAFGWAMLITWALMGAATSLVARWWTARAADRKPR